MSRIFSRTEGRMRSLLDNEISCLTEKLNEAIAKAIADGYTPDIVVDNGPLLILDSERDELSGLEQPYVRVKFFRHGDTVSKE